MSGSWRAPDEAEPAAEPPPPPPPEVPAVSCQPPSSPDTSPEGERFFDSRDEKRRRQPGDPTSQKLKSARSFENLPHGTSTPTFGTREGNVFSMDSLQTLYRPGPFTDSMQSASRSEPVGILSLPPELLESVISYLTFETTSNVRLVCRAFERASRRRLNQGFARAERYVAQALKLFRGQLPRRESERREHPLARRVEHLAAVETRLGLLSMTYRRYMDSDVCCFIPGRVLDEVFRVVRYLKEAPSVERSSFTILQELRDISSMAMEHFEEHIVPHLKKTETRPRPLSLLSLLSGGVTADDGSGGHSSGDAWPGPACLSSLLTSQRSASEARNKSMTDMEQAITKLNQKVASQRAQSAAQSQALAELRQQVGEQAEKLSAQDLVIADLSSKLARLEERLRAHTGQPADPTDGKARKRPAGPGAAAPAAPPAAPAPKRARTAPQDSAQ